MTRPKHNRRPLDLHPVEWCGGPLGGGEPGVTEMRRLLGKGVEVPDDYALDVNGRVKITVRHLRNALSCMAMGNDISRHITDFVAIPHGDLYINLVHDGTMMRATDRILAKLKSCGAITYDAKARRWVVTPCEWVEA